MEARRLSSPSLLRVQSPKRSIWGDPDDPPHSNRIAECLHIKVVVAECLRIWIPCKVVVAECLRIWIPLQGSRSRMPSHLDSRNLSAVAQDAEAEAGAEKIRFKSRFKIRV